MKHFLCVILLIIVCSSYFFPYTLTKFPVANSKMMVAAIGLVLFSWEQIRNKTLGIRGDLFPMLVLGLLFSLSSFFSVVYNSTNDFIYATYFVSMCVWLGGAYCVLYLLRHIYGVSSIRLVFIYLAVVCAVQCIVAVLIDNSVFVRNMVNSVFVIDTEYFKNTPRLYGIGADFDTAGIRFSCVLMGLAYLNKEQISLSRRGFYLVLYLIIGVMGNMISRTTVIGVGLSCLYMLMTSLSWLTAKITLKGIFFGLGSCLLLVLLVYIGIDLYHNQPGARMTMQYGFEGFFNLFGTGSFSTHSSDLLLDNIFVVWPDNMKTWIIGDGYFADPYEPELFYKGTDMGYARLIFYCGLVGLLFFLLYFGYCTYALCRRDRRFTLFFVFLLVVQLIVWVKIPTDIFCFYALLLLADGIGPRDYSYINTKI